MTGGLAGSGQIEIDDFDIFAAETAPKGFFGVKLKGAITITSGANLSFTLEIDAPSAKDQTFRVKLSDAKSTDFNLSGAKTLQLNSDGSFDVVLKANTAKVSFSLIDKTANDGKSDIAPGAKLHLSATLNDSVVSGGQALTSDAFTFIVPPKQKTSGADPKNTTAIVSSSTTTGAYQGDGGNDQVLAAFTDNSIDLGNSVNDIIKGGTGYNVVAGGSGNDVITLLGTHDQVRLGTGHNTVNGSSGHDTIKSSLGTAVVNGHNGTHIVLLGSGNNEIYADSQIALGAAISQASTATASHQKGDLIAVLDGNDTIVSGKGDDLINAGSGHSVVVLGPGQDTFLGGWDVTNALDSWHTEMDNGVLTVVDADAFVESYSNPYAQPYNGNFTGDGGNLKASASNATVFGGSGNDLIYLGNGSNYVQAGSGNTTIFGGMGNDWLIAGSGNDFVRGGGGNTHIEGGSGSATLLGGDGNNTIIGGSGNATIHSAAISPDIAVNGRWDNDTLSNNYVFTGGGDDVVFGSAGHDTLIAGSGHVTIQGGLGAEYMIGGSGKSFLIAGTGNDTLIAGTGEATLQGGGSSTTKSWLYGGDGTDLIVGGSGENVLFAGNGGTTDKKTTVSGSMSDASSKTTINGGAGVDWLQGGAGTVVINTGDGGTAGAATTVVAGSGATTVNGGAGVDFISGGSGASVLNSGNGGTSAAATTVLGASGVSTLSGGAGAAILYDTASGQDVLLAGSGSDTLVGFGADTFIGGQGQAIVQNNGGRATVNLGSQTGSVAIYNFDGGTTKLGLSGGVGPADLAATVTFDGLGRTFLAFDMPTGYVSIQGGLTGALTNTTFDSGSVSTTTLMTTVFHSDQAFHNGSSTVYVDVGVSESLSGGTGPGDTVSAWGANETITGSGGYSEVIYSGGAYANISGGRGDDSITASGDHAVVVTGQYGNEVTLSGANSIATNNSSGLSRLTASGLNDTLVGGTAATQFFVNDITATVVSANPTGQDAVTSTVNFTLPTHVNQLTLAGTADIVGTGNSGANVLIGGAGHDTLVAGSGGAAMTGGTTSTVFVVNNSADTVNERYAANVDTVVSSVNYVLPSSVNILKLSGSAALTATANANADTLISNSGIDTLYGGGGGDLFIINNAADIIVEASSATNDTLQTAFGITLPSNVNALVLTGSAALTATANSGNDTLVSNTGIDTLVGGAGNDVFVVNNSLDVVKGASATSSNTVIASVDFTLPTNVNTLTLTGTASLKATGNAAADTITANSGNDTLTAVSTTKATTLVGGAGNDVFVVNNTADVIVSASTTSNDTIQSSVDFTAVANVNSLVLTGTGNLKATANAAGDTLVSNTGVDTLVGGTGRDTFIVNNAADVLVNVGVDDTVISYVGGAMPSGANNLLLGGSANLQATTSGGNVQLTGNAGSDTLYATSGQDTLVAGSGLATLVSGTGNDVFVVNSTSDVVSLSGAHGVDTVQSSVNWTLQNGINMLVLTGNGNLAGRAVSGNNRINANAGSDTLYAGSGNDTLSAQDGPATLVGGAGTDTFIIGSTADVIQNISASGNTVYSSVNYAMQAGVAVLRLFGDTHVVATGNATADTLVGNFGNDTLQAGTGVAWMEGGMGADLFIVNNVLDVVNQSNYGQKGTADTIQSSVSYTLPGTVDNLVLTGTADLKAIGNQNADVIVGNSGKDTLVAGQGDDTLISGSGVTLLQGGPGNDTFVVNNQLDTVTTSAADSYNVLQSSVTYTMPANISELVLIGSGNIKGTSNGMDVLMTAGDGADTLVATTGQDTLTAGNGLVTMTGGTGNDTFVVNNSNDVITDATTNKNNAILASASFVLPANIETLTLTGSADISATGNADGRTDTLNAAYGNDTLVAGSDVAVMNGGPGATTFVVNNIGDVVQNADATQTNALQSSVTYTLPTNVNLLTLTGTGAITGTGNASADTLESNAGASTLVSGAGNDLLILNSATARATNAFTTNSDTLQSAFNATLAGNINMLVLTGAAALTGKANAGNDTLISNSGADTLTGGAGNDVFIVNNAADVVNGASTGGNNTIIAGVNVTLPTNVNTLLLTGTADLQATGNSAADRIVANDGNDTLTAVSTAAATTLVGGIGNDVFVVNNTADVIQVASTTALDTIQSSANFAAFANVNTLVLTGTANLKATANDAGDTLVSNTGVDTLVGGAGNDLFVVNNAADVIVNLSAGDTVESSVAFSMATPGVELILIGSANRADTISGAADTLVAGDGNDTLTAAVANETMVSGLGSDLFIVNDSSDVVVESVDGGAHSIQSSVSYTLPDYIDILTLTGSGDLTATGNADYGNLITANGGRDHIIGTAYSNTIMGGSGRNLIEVGPGLNLVHAGSGGTQYDTTYVYGNNSAGGSEVSDVIYGDTGYNVLYGGLGSNTIVGGTNTENIVVRGASNLVNAGTSGTSGSPLQIDASGETATSNTTIVGSSGAEVIAGGAGTDLMTAGSGATTISAGSGSTTIQGGSGINVITGGAGTNLIISGSGATTISAGSGSTTIQGGSGINVITGGAGTNLIAAGTGATTINAGTGYATLYGSNGSVINDMSSGHDLLVAGAGAETLLGMGADTLVTGSGSDVFLGGYSAQSGNTYQFNAGFGQVSIQGGGQPGNILKFGHGFALSGFTASVQPSGGNYSGVNGTSLVLHYGNESVAIQGGLSNGVISSIVLADSGPVTLAQIVNAGGPQNTLFTMNGGDTGLLSAGDGLTVTNVATIYQAFVFGNSDLVTGLNTYAGIQAYGNADTLVGGGMVGYGNSQVFMMSDNQGANVYGANATITGHSGNQVYLMASPGKIAFTGSGNVLYSTVSVDLPTGVDSFQLASGHDSLVAHSNSAGGCLMANGDHDTLVGASGVDTLQATGKYDLLVGGSGATTYWLADATDSIQLGTGGAANNTIIVSSSYTLPAGINNLVLQGSSDVGTANSGNDLLSTTGYAQTLVGGVGNDTLVGNGNGNTYVGGSGKTTFVNISGYDHVVENYANTGSVLQGYGTITMPTNVDNFVDIGSYTTVTANAGNDSIVASTYYSDTIIAGVGSDTLVAGGQPGGTGDTFVFNAGFTHDLITNVQANAHHVLQFGAGITRASLTFSVLQGVAGSTPSLLVTSGSRSVTVQGGLAPGAISAVTFADNTSFTLGQLLAPSGTATIAGAGGGGNLILVGSDDTVVTGGTGHDTIMAWGNGDTLKAGTGGAVVCAGGNADVVVGSASNDTLSAYGASDSLVSGSGNEIFVVNSTDAVVNVSAGQLHDTVQATVNYTVPANVSVMQLMGPNLTGTGGTTAATIVATSANDTLRGGSLADTLIGSASGGDLFVINSTANVLVGGAGGATDTVSSSINYTLPAGIDNLLISAYSLMGKANDDAHVYMTASGFFDTLVGGAGADTLVGGASDAYLVSGSGIDVLVAADQETIVVNNSADTVVLGGGADTIQSSVDFALPTMGSSGYSVTWQLIGTVGRTAAATAEFNNIHFIGNAGQDTLVGGTVAGSYNTLESGAVADVLIGGGAGTTNTFITHNSSDTVTASAAAASNKISTTASITLPDNVFVIDTPFMTHNLVLTANSGNDTMYGNLGATLVGGSGNDYMGGYGPGNVMYVAGTGNDTIAASHADSITLGTGFGHVDVFSPSGASTNPVLVQFGDAAANLTASIISDSNGNAGLKLVNGTSVVTLEGAFGTNNYQFKFGAASPVPLERLLALVQEQNSTFVGAAGNLILNGTASANLHAGTGADTILAAGISDTLTGGSGAQWLEAVGTNVSVVGGSGADTLEGFGTNDTLVGGTAADTFVGGTGASVLLVINNASDVVQLQSNSGNDTVATALNNYALPTGVNTLVLQGSAALKGTANNGADTMVSNTGVDTLVGGTGADLFVLNNATDVVSVGGTHGVDTIQAAFNDTLAANVAVLVLGGSTALMGTGNAIADTLKANDFSDTLVAGAGAATMIGGAGNDLFLVNNTSDSVQSAAGNDTISSSVSFTLPTNVNTLVLTGGGASKGVGNAASDLLTAAGTTGAVSLVAGAGADTLVSGTGTDSLVGGTGNDLFIVNSATTVVTDASSAGSDTVQSTFTTALQTNVNTLVLSGSGAISGTANGGADFITASATTGAVTLTGGTGADTLIAGGGADVLVSGAGIDSLVGGSGNDKFVVNNTTDVVVNSFTTNVDTISSSANYVLPANVNTLVLTGSGLSGTGNAAADLITAAGTTGAVTLNAGASTAADTLVAGNGADVLVSNSGVDSLVGGTGADLFVLNNAGDIVVVGATHGVDTIQASFNDTLAANVAVLVLKGSAGLMGTGNAIADTLRANDYGDTLVAGSGAATMIGGAGNDLFLVNSISDSVQSAAGADTISSSVTFALPANVQVLKLTGSGALTGTGNATTSLVVGNTGADTLVGGTGIAVLEAGTAGLQVLKATSNQAALIGGGAANTLTGGAYKDFFASGKVGDAVTTGATANVIAFNKGDGALVIAPTTGASNVLSLGAGIDTEALTFTKSGNNLVLNDGVAGDSITFTNWFAAAANQTTKTLQVIESASASYNSAGTDVLRNKPIEEFNFTTLVANYTTAGNPAGWQLSQKEAADTIASSATAAYGGDLAYYYGNNGNLTGMNLSASQSTLTNASYATGLQTIDAWASISGGASPVALAAAGPSAAATPFAPSVDSTSEGHVTIQPIVRNGTMKAAYVSASQLSAVMREEGGTLNATTPTAERVRFGNLWSAMHRQLDMVRTTESLGAGAEVQGVGLSPDVVAMLSGAAASPTHGPDRKVTFPTSHLHQA